MITCRPSGPGVLVSEAAWRDMTRWFRRWYPSEAVVYPLAAFPDDPGPSPLEVMDRWASPLVITHGLLPWEGAAAFERNRARFEPDEAEAASRALEREAASLVAHHRRLAILAKIHTHPHPRAAYLSREDVIINVVQAQEWWLARGLGFGIMLVGYLVSDSHAAGYELGSELSWAMAVFEVGFDGSITRHGDAVVLARDHPIIEKTLAAPFWATDTGRSRLQGFVDALDEQGLYQGWAPLPRGWVRIRLSGGWDLCLPPGFPADSARLIPPSDAGLGASGRPASWRCVRVSSVAVEDPFELARRVREICQGGR